MYIPERGASWKEDFAYFISCFTLTKVIIFFVFIAILSLIGDLVLKYGMDNGIAHIFFLLIFIAIVGIISSVVSSLEEKREFRKEYKKAFNAYKKLLPDSDELEISTISRIMAEGKFQERKKLQR